MEKKMYNVPSTAVTEVEALNVIMGVTASGGGTEPITGNDEPGGGDAPQRYPKF